MRIKIEFSLEKDENDIDLTPIQVCELVESILYSGAMQENVYINDIHSIERDGEID